MAQWSAPLIYEKSLVHDVRIDHHDPVAPPKDGPPPLVFPHPVVYPVLVAELVADVDTVHPIIVGVVDVQAEKRHSLHAVRHLVEYLPALESPKNRTAAHGEKMDRLGVVDRHSNEERENGNAVEHCRFNCPAEITKEDEDVRFLCMTKIK